MRARVPDPAYTASPRAGRNFVLALKVVAGLVFVMWALFLFDQFTGLQLIRYGLVPRDPGGLVGLVTTPLLHYNLGHIASNTLPLLVGGTMMLFLYPNASVRALPAVWFGSGLLSWLIARDSIHIGASGVVYGVLAFVFVSGVIRRDLRSIGAALVIWFLYGSMIWGVLPVGRGMSWELHATGLAIGVWMAWRYRNWDHPPMKRYDWEDEQPPEDAEQQPWRRAPERWH